MDCLTTRLSVAVLILTSVVAVMAQSSRVSPSTTPPPPPIKGRITAKVLSANVYTYQRGTKSVHCEDNSKGGTDCDVTPPASGNILVAAPGSVASAYLNLELPDHRTIGLTCEP